MTCNRADLPRRPFFFRRDTSSFLGSGPWVEVPVAVNPVYRSRAWASVRKQVLARDGFCCQIRLGLTTCERARKLRPRRSGSAYLHSEGTAAF
jgi:hypothetical protein